MKKFLTIITAMALLASLTACSNVEGEPQSNSSQTVSQNSETSTDNNSENLEDPENSGNSEKSLKELIDAFEMDDFPAPDGEILKKADAVGVEGSGDYVYAVTYDFAYMRKVQPVFVNTLDDPSAFDWDNMEFKSMPETPEHLGWFKIKAGDVLDNGLTVKSASLSLGHGMDSLVYYTSAEFDGELTLEGVLYCYPEDDYNISKGDVIFFPNTAKHLDFVVPYDDLDSEPNMVCMPGSEFALLHSGKGIGFGSESELPNGISELFAHDNIVKASVILTDLRYRKTTTGVRISANVKSAEPLT